MNLWQTLDTSRAALGGPLAAEAAILADTFAALDDGIGELSAIASELASVTSVLGVKGRNLALACYTLILSGLAQESGALLRPLVETIEQITYVRLDEQRLDEVRNGTLPTAGLIAQAIDSPHHKLRTYLNKNASHIGEGEYTFRHLIEKDGSLLLVQPYREQNVRVNLGTLFAVALLVAFEIANCVVAATGRRPSTSLVDRLERCQRTGPAIFGGR